MKIDVLSLRTNMNTAVNNIGPSDQPPLRGHGGNIIAERDLYTKIFWKACSQDL